MGMEGERTAGWTMPLAAGAATESELAGGKGASLAMLTRAGLPVPPGFVLTTAAYKRYLADTGLAGLVEREAKTLDLYRLRHCEQLSGLVAAHMERHPLPEEVAAGVTAACCSLWGADAVGGNGATPVAVRSSATAEDLPTASFAGQLESFLNVKGEADLLAAVRRCWASLWSARAIHYRQQRGIPHLGAAMAVVIQQMVPADSAGVLFTANPVSGWRDQVLIEAAPGLGEGVVSGSAAVDRYVLHGQSGAAVEEAVAPGRGAPVLTRAERMALLDLGRQVESLYGRPQDVEWAMARGRVWLLQARPITTLAAEPDDLPAVTLPRVRRNPLTTMTAVMLSDRWTTALPPFDLQTTGRAQEEGLLAVLSRVGLVGPHFEDSFIHADGVLLHVLPYDLRIHPRLIWNGPWLLAGIFRDPARWAQNELPALERKLSALEQEVETFPTAPDEALLAVIDRVMQQMRDTFMSRKDHFFDPVRRAIFDRLVGMAGEERAAQLQADLMAGIDHATSRAHRALEALAATLGGEPALVEALAELEPALFLQRLPDLTGGAAFRQEFEGFLRRFGCRELYYGGPSWSEAPEAVVGLLQSLVAGGGAPQAAGAPDQPAGAAAPRDPGARCRQAAAEAEAALPALLRPLFRRLLYLVRAGEAFMEDSHWQLNRPIPVMRAAARELGRRLTDRGLLADPADVFYLVPGELAQLLAGTYAGADKLAGIIARRKRWLAAARRKSTLVPMEYLPAAGSDHLLQGVPVGCGQATGRVRLIRSEADFGRFRRGEVLVAPFTNPAWTPLFSLAAAVVVDTGGTASHAAIVAREYAIAAVMGTRRGTEFLTDGDLVRVDGIAGTVQLLQRGACPAKGE